MSNKNWQKGRRNKFSEEEFDDPHNNKDIYNSRKYQSSQRRTGRGTRRTRYRRQRKRVRGGAVKGAQNQLKRFRQGSMLALAITSFLLLLFTPEEIGYSQDTAQVEDSQTQPASIPDTVSVIEDIPTSSIIQSQAQSESEELNEDLGEAAKDEAVTTLKNLWEGFYANLPKILVAIGILILTWIILRLLKLLLARIFNKRKSYSAMITLVNLGFWLLAIGLAVSVVAGDIRALVGSLGLIGLALSWSLQTPIESFTGWILNSFRGYYRVGDRISVGDVFGDVHKIDFLTTTVWEIGAPFRPGFVQAEQPTGRLVTFPNNEILAGTVVNLTGDFPYVWDELAIAVANESDIKEAMKVMEEKATSLLGEYMHAPAEHYEKTLFKAGLDYPIPRDPQVYISIGESWTDVIIRYLVGARERRTWKSRLSLEIIEELNKSDYQGRIKSVYPRQQVQIIKPDGTPEEPGMIRKQE